MFRSSTSHQLVCDAHHNELQYLYAMQYTSNMHADRATIVRFYNWAYTRKLNIIPDTLSRLFNFEHSEIRVAPYLTPICRDVHDNSALHGLFFFFFFFFFFISLIADGPHHYHPACGHKGSSHLSPVHALHFFYRDASSALLQLVSHWLNFTYSRSHAFRYERKNTNPTLVRIELTTSVLADVQLTY